MNAVILLFLIDTKLTDFLNDPGVEKSTLIKIILVLLLIVVFLLAFEVRRLLLNRRPLNLSRYFRKVKLEVILEKDRSYKPRVLTLTIRNNGKHETSIEAPVLEYRKIWSIRKFRLNGIRGNQIYPMFIDAGKMHQLRIDTTTFYEYDRSIKSFYRARVRVADVQGRKWRSNAVVLRKSLFT